MYLTAKSAIEENQLRNKKINGAKYIELHLFEEDIKDKLYIEDKIQILQDSELEVVSVHIPINRVCTLEGILSYEGFDMIERTCYLAQKIAEYQGNMVNVVIHQELSFNQLKDWELIDKIGDEINILLHLHKDIIINIENLQLICPNEDKLYSSNNYLYDNVEVCKYLRRYLRNDRIGTVLDICHMLSTIEQLKILGLYEKYKNINLDYMIKRNKGYLDIVHLTNSREIGFDIGHGCSFDTEEECDKLKVILDKLKDIGFDGKLVLEVQEETYLNSVEFKKLLNQVENII